MRRGHTARWGIRRQRSSRGNFFHRLRMLYDPPCGSVGQVTGAGQLGTPDCRVRTDFSLRGGHHSLDLTRESTLVALGISCSHHIEVCVASLNCCVGIIGRADQRRIQLRVRTS